MKKWFIFPLFLFLLACNVIAEEHETNIYVFYGQGCPHCSQMLQFLDSIKDNYPTLNIELFEVYSNQTNRLLFIDYAKKCGSSVSAVPTVIIDKKVFVGFSNSLATSLKEEIQRCIVVGCEDVNTCPEDSTEYIADSDPINPQPEPYHSFVGWAFIIVVILIIGYAVVKKVTKR